jgi:protein gp37
VAIGATNANQEEYDRDRMKLAEVKETRGPLFTFGSFEPLLSRIVLDKNAPDWIIAGGETDQGSHKARPTDPEWFRYLRDQSRELSRAFFMKQMTRKAAIPDDLLVRQWPTTGVR